MSGPSQIQHAVRRDVSMLVADITHFTSFSDITEPEYVFETLTEYHRLSLDDIGQDLKLTALTRSLDVFELRPRPSEQVA